MNKMLGKHEEFKELPDDVREAFLEMIFLRWFMKW
jgi:hypothetical protein